MIELDDFAHSKSRAGAASTLIKVAAVAILDDDYKSPLMKAA